jgi:dipicolinate synthase subunit A
MLGKMPQRMLIIELASAPGCMDARTQKQCKQKIIRAASLPGKISPITAGKILFESIEWILTREGVLPV